MDPFDRSLWRAPNQAGPDSRAIDGLSSSEKALREKAQLQRALNVAETNRAIANAGSIDHGDNTSSASSTADTDVAGVIQYGDPECSGSSHETPKVVDDDDAASTASSETIRADSMPPLLDEDSNDDGSGGEVEDAENEDDGTEEDEEVDNDGDDDCDSDNKNLGSEVSKVLLEQFDRLSEAMTIVEINLEAFEDYLHNGSIVHKLPARIEGFNKLRDIVEKMDRNIEELDREARYLSASSKNGDVAVKLVNDRVGTMRIVERELDASRRIADIHRGIRSFVEQQQAPAADPQTAQRERYVTYPHPSLSARPSADAWNPPAQSPIAAAELHYSSYDPSHLPSAGPYGNYLQPPSRVGLPTDVPSARTDIYPDGSSSLPTSHAGLSIDASLAQTGIYSAGSSSNYNAYLQQQRATSTGQNQTPSIRGQMRGNQTRGGQTRGGQMRGRQWRGPHPSVHMRRVQPAVARPHPQDLAERGQARGVSSVSSFHPQNCGCPWCNLPSVQKSEDSSTAPRNPHVR